MIKNLTTKMLRYFLLGIMVACSILVYAGDANPSGDAAGAGKPTKLLDGFGNMLDLLEPHNTPIGLSYDFAGGVGLEFALDNVAYKRDVDNVSNVSMNLRAAFTLPFSVSKGKNGVSQIVFRGEDINYQNVKKYLFKGITEDKLYMVSNYLSYSAAYIQREIKGDIGAFDNVFYASSFFHYSEMSMYKNNKFYFVKSLLNLK